MVGIPKTLHISEHYPDRMGAWMAGILKTLHISERFSMLEKSYPYSGSAAQIFIWTNILENSRTRCIPGKFLDVLFTGVHYNPTNSKEK